MIKNITFSLLLCFFCVLLEAQNMRQFEGVQEFTYTVENAVKSETNSWDYISYSKGENVLNRCIALGVNQYFNYSQHFSVPTIIVNTIETGEQVGYKTTMVSRDYELYLAEVMALPELGRISKFGYDWVKVLFKESYSNSQGSGTQESTLWICKEVGQLVNGVLIPLIYINVSKMMDHNGKLLSTSTQKYTNITEQAIEESLFNPPTGVRILDDEKGYTSYYKSVVYGSDYDLLVAKHQLESSSYGEPSDRADTTTSSVTESSSTDAKQTSAADKYRRSSLYTAFLAPRNKHTKYAAEIKQLFLSLPVPDKYDDHTLPLRVLPVSLKGNVTKNIDSYLNEINLGRYMVAKWFNRNAKGESNMNLIFERGMYDASLQDALLSSYSVRREALLKDAGMELIGNTFLLVNDIRYVDKEQAGRIAAAVFMGLAGVASGVASAYSSTNQNVSQIADAVGSLSAVGALASTILAKGFTVKITSYLYQLDWNDRLTEDYMANYWMDAESYDINKKIAFDGETQKYKLKYIGKQSVVSDVQSTIFSAKTNEQLIQKTLADALDKVVVKLQKEYEIFKVKTPVVSTDPVMAHIGTKDGVTKKKSYYIYQPIKKSEDAPITYKRIAKLKPDPKMIWENRFMASQMIRKAENQSISGTEFKVVSGSASKIEPGMLLHEGKIKPIVDKELRRFKTKGSYYGALETNYGLNVDPMGFDFSASLINGGFISPYFGMGVGLGVSWKTDETAYHDLYAENKVETKRYIYMCLSPFLLFINFRGYIQDYRTLAINQRKQGRDMKKYFPFMTYWSFNAGIYPLPFFFEPGVYFGVGCFTFGLNYRFTYSGMRNYIGEKFLGYTDKHAVSLMLGLTW